MCERSNAWSIESYAADKSDVTSDRISNNDNNNAITHKNDTTQTQLYNNNMNIIRILSWYILLIPRIRQVLCIQYTYMLILSLSHCKVYNISANCTYNVTIRNINSNSTSRIYNKCLQLSTGIVYS